MTYNLTFADTSNTLYDFFLGLNTMVNGAFMVFFLFVLFLVIFLVFKGTGHANEVIFLIGGFITSLVAIMLFASGMIGLTVVFTPIVVTVFSFIYFMARGAE